MKDDLINVVSEGTTWAETFRKKKIYEKPIKRKMLNSEYPSEGSESKRGFVYQGYMGKSCAFGSGTESKVGAREVSSSILCSLAHLTVL